MIRSIFLRADAREVIHPSTRKNIGQEPDTPFTFPDRPVKVGRTGQSPLWVWHAVIDDAGPLFERAKAHASFLGISYQDLRGRAFERQVFEAEWDEDELDVLTQRRRRVRKRGKMTDRPADKPAVDEFLPPHHFFGVED